MSTRHRGTSEMSSGQSRNQGQPRPRTDPAAGALSQECAPLRRPTGHRAVGASRSGPQPLVDASKKVGTSVLA